MLPMVVNLIWLDSRRYYDKIVIISKHSIVTKRQKHAGWETQQLPASYLSMAMPGLNQRLRSTIHYDEVPKILALVTMRQLEMFTFQHSPEQNTSIYYWPLIEDLANRWCLACAITAIIYIWNYWFTTVVCGLVKKKRSITGTSNNNNNTLEKQETKCHAKTQ